MLLAFRDWMKMIHTEYALADCKIHAEISSLHTNCRLGLMTIYKDSQIPLIVQEFWTFSLPSYLSANIAGKHWLNIYVLALDLAHILRVERRRFSTIFLKNSIDVSPTSACFSHL